MRETLYFLFGKEYGDYLLSSNIAYIASAAAVLTVGLSVFIAVYLTRRKSRSLPVKPKADGKPEAEEKPKEEVKPESEVKPKEEEKPESEEKLKTEAEEAPKAEENIKAEEKDGTGDKKAEESGSVEEEPDEESKNNIPVDEKPGMIKNPLKVPPVKERSVPDYDYEVSEEDDYDIK